jgi:transposase-like protein
MAKTERRDHTPDKKAEIVRRHLVDGVPVSDLCDEYKIAPSLFYGWQKQVLDAMSSTLEHGARRNANRESARLREAEERIAALEARLAKKDTVIAEISAEYVALKKELGEI